MDRFQKDIETHKDNGGENLVTVPNKKDTTSVLNSQENSGSNDSKTFKSKVESIGDDPESMSCGEDMEFECSFAPDEMRCLALLAHNHMKPAMKRFVLANKNLLKKFRLTGTNTTMAMLEDVFQDDSTVNYGPTFHSGPLGGDAELCALMCTEDLGGMIFLQDPMDSHPHQADIACLNRQANVHDILVANNPSSANGMMGTLRMALMTGNVKNVSSFFNTKYSPSVEEYNNRRMLGVNRSANLQRCISYDFSTDNSASGFSEDKEKPKVGVSDESALRKLVDTVISIDTVNEECVPEGGARNYERNDLQCFNGDFISSDANFESMFPPEEMRYLALAAHNHMIPAIKSFIQSNRNVLKKFILTGNNTIMDMLKKELGDDPYVKYGPVYRSGPLGGDTQLGALMCLNQLGGLIFFQDPMGTHPHQVDIDCLIRQCNVHDIYFATNSSSATAMMCTVKYALKFGNSECIKSFFETRASPSVAEYKKRQREMLKCSGKNSFNSSSLIDLFSFFCSFVLLSLLLFVYNFYSL